MKRLVVLLSLVVFTMSYSYAARERSTAEVAKKEIKANADRDSRKSAKRMAKDGWMTMPGRLPLDKQIERSKIAEISVDEKGENIYLIGSHSAVGGNYSAAKSIAIVRAKAELASQLKSHLKRNIMDKNSSKQLSQDDIQLLDETISATVESVDLDMSGVNNILEIYRNADGRSEVMVTLSVKSDILYKQSIEKIGNELAGKTDLLIE